MLMFFLMALSSLKLCTSSRESSCNRDDYPKDCVEYFLEVLHKLMCFCKDPASGLAADRVISLLCTWQVDCDESFRADEDTELDEVEDYACALRELTGVLVSLYP